MEAYLIHYSPTAINISLRQCSCLQVSSHWFIYNHILSTRQTTLVCGQCLRVCHILRAGTQNTQDRFTLSKTRISHRQICSPIPITHFTTTYGIVLLFTVVNHKITGCVHSKDYMGFLSEYQFPSNQFPIFHFPQKQMLTYYWSGSYGWSMP